MAKQRLAKLTRPRLFGIVARLRLFELLDQARSGSAVWISGPPGAGKTMLAASYVESRKANTVWYQVDAADGDPATLFHYLDSAAPQKRSKLPIFSAQHQADLIAFSRCFFRNFFGRLKPGAILVVDGLAPLAAATTLTTILREAVQEVPDGLNVIVISRTDPPAEFARLGLQGVVTMIGWDHLRLTLEETHRIAEGVPGLDDDALASLHRDSGGWMAGLRLLLDHYQRTGRLTHSRLPGERDALFGFFATEIFDGLPEPTRQALLRTSLLPQITPQAARALGGDTDTWRILEELSERHLFVDRLDGATSAFQYHALFREFLCSRAKGDLQPARYRSLQRQAGVFLASAGQTEHAIPLLSQAGDWAATTRLILVEASRLLTRGHSRTLMEWVRALPSWYVAATPRLLYCLGIAQTAGDPDNAKVTLERAHERFLAEDNELGQVLSAAAIIQTVYLRFDSFVELPHWIDALETLLLKNIVFPSTDVELHARTMLQVALTYARPDHPRLFQHADRVLQLLARGTEVNQMVVSAALILPCFDWHAPEKARLLVGFIEPILQHAEVAPFNRSWWLLSAGCHHRHQCENKKMQAAFAQAREVSERGGLRSTQTLVSMVRLYEAIAVGAQLKDGLEIEALESVTSGRRQENLIFHVLAAQVAIQRRDPLGGLEQGQRAVKLARNTGNRASEMEALGLLAIAMAEAGNAEAALDAIRAARRIAGPVREGKLEFHHASIEAYIHITSGNRELAMNLLRCAFGIGREHGYCQGFFRFPHMTAQLCAEALGAGIEMQHVQCVIQKYRLMPPSQDVAEHWPWPVRLRVLGRFEVHIEGVLLEFSGKTQKKPLELLKALVSKSAVGADLDLLAQELWPDSEGDAGENALRMALHRLRKLLKCDQAILVHEGKVRLNDRVCWVDAWVFESACNTLERAEADSISLETTCRRALALYRGPAFEGDVPLPWMLPAHDRWRSKFLAAIAWAGAAAERRGLWENAVEIYRRGIEVDPLSEELYRRQMICYLKHDKPSEAYGIYRRCRDMLSITLGLRPSAETEALRQRAMEQGMSATPLA